MPQLFAILLLFSSLLLQAQGLVCDSLQCYGSTFSKNIRSPEGLNMKGSCLLPLANGSFYLGGTLDSAIYLALHEANGQVVWEKAIPTPSEDAQLFVLNQLYQDSDGLLVGIGSIFNSPTIQRAFVFRFDPRSDYLWYFHIYSQNSEMTKLLELNDQAAYLIFGSRLGEPPPIFESILIEKIDKTTGLPIQNSQRYDLGGREQISQAIRYGDKVYATGVYTLPNIGTGGNRAMLARFDLAGNHEFSYTGYQDFTANSRLFGFDIRIHNQTLYLLQWGSIDLVAGGIGTQMILSAFSLEGVLRWNRIYDITNYQGENGIDMQLYQDGLLILGHDLSNFRDIFLLQLDWQGNPLWNVAYNTPDPALLYWRSNQQLQILADGLLISTTFSPGNGDPDYIQLLRTGPQGELADSCLAAYQLNLTHETNELPWSEQTPGPLAADGSWQPYSTAAQFIENIHESNCALTCCPPCAYHPVGEDNIPIGTSAGASVCLGAQVFFNGQTYSSAGTYYAENACGSVDTLVLTVLPSPEATLLQHTICEGDSLFLAASYRFTSGTYPEIQRAANGCDSLILHQLVVLTKALPLIEQGFDCESQQTLIRLLDADSSRYRFQWTDTPNAEAERLLASGIYFLQLQYPNGCENTLIFELQDESLPTTALAATYSVLLGESHLLQPNFNLPLPPGSRLEWSEEGGEIICTNCPTLLLMPTSSQRYRLRLISPSGCVQSFYFDVVLDRQAAIYLPTAFSPNADGYNDYYRPYTSSAVARLLQFQIYDRWGGLVFERLEVNPHEEDSGWDGTKSNQALAAGVYLVKVNYLLQNGDSAQAVQAFVLLR